MTTTARKIPLTLAQMDEQMSEYMGKPSLLVPAVTSLYDTRAQIGRLDGLQKTRRTELTRRFELGARASLCAGREHSPGRLLVMTKGHVVTKTTVRGAKVQKLAPDIYRQSRAVVPYVQAKREEHSAGRHTPVMDAHERRSLDVMIDRYEQTKAELTALRATEKEFAALLAAVNERAQDWDGTAVVTSDGWIFSATRLQFDADTMARLFPEDYARLAETTITEVSGHVRIIRVTPEEIRAMQGDAEYQPGI